MKSSEKVMDESHRFWLMLQFGIFRQGAA